jgi:hypothetical protein
VNHLYRGYQVTPMATPTDDGKHRAVAAIVSMGGSRTRSQRFIDLGVFSDPAVAKERALLAAESWIDSEAAKDQLALPTNFSPFL